jgi:hypothetical protein
MEMTITPFHPEEFEDPHYNVTFSAALIEPNPPEQTPVSYVKMIRASELLADYDATFKKCLDVLDEACHLSRSFKRERHEYSQITRKLTEALCELHMHLLETMPEEQIERLLRFAQVRLRKSTVTTTE